MQVPPEEQHLIPRSSEQEISMLPDDIIVSIGVTVAKLCGLHDFVSLSLASKQFQKLLIGSKETVLEVIRIRTRNDNDEENTQKGTWLPSFSLRPISINSLEQLAFYESVKQHNLLWENRICESPNLDIDNRVHFEYSDLEFHSNSTRQSCMNLIRAIRAILKKHPKAFVILDAHSGTQVPDKVAELYSDVRGKVVLESILCELNPVVTDKRIRLGLPTQKRDSYCKWLHNRIRIRSWGKMVSTLVLEEENHPYQKTAQQGRGWIEVYFRMEDPDDNGGIPLVLPPRPSYYNRVTENYRKRNQR